MVRVSVVVPTYRRPDLLARCLSALACQDLTGQAPAFAGRHALSTSEGRGLRSRTTPFEDSGCASQTIALCDAYEILVADDAASEATRRQVEEFAASTGAPVRYVPVLGIHGPAAARNAGWQAARGEIIAFTDDDCLPAPTWLATGLAAFAEGVAAVSGRVIVPRPEVPTDYERDAAGLEEAEFVTANCFCRRAALEAVGGFDESFAAAWREDSDLHFTLLERGGRIVREPRAIVVHPVRPARWGISLAQQRKGLFDALLYKKHPGLYRQRINPRPLWEFYAIVVSLIAAGILAAAGRPWPALVAGAVWTALTARFAARRLRGTSHEPCHVAEMLATSAAIPPLSVFWRLYGACRFRVFFL